MQTDRQAGGNQRRAGIPTEPMGTGTFHGIGGAVTVLLLGPVVVVREGVEVALGGTRHGTLLCLLALAEDAGLTVSVLADELWGSGPPPGAASTIRTYATRLRRSLDAGTSRSLVVAGHGSYRLRTGAYGSDVGEFEHLVRCGRDASSGEDRSDLLRRAERLWRGRAYADVRQTPLMLAEAGRLEELHLLAVEDRIAAELGLGLHRELVSDLHRLATAEPLRERICRMLVLALHRSGRQAEALRAAHAHRTRLREELGIDPTRELAALEHAVLTRDPELDWHPPRAREGRTRLASAARSLGVPGALDLGRQLLASGEFEKASALFTGEFASAGEPTDEPGRELACDLLLGLAEARRGARDLAGTQSAALAAANYARELGSPGRLATAAVWATSQNTVGHLDGAVEALCLEALDSLAPAATDLRARVLAGLVDYLGFAVGDGDKAVEIAAAALGLATESGDPTAIARCLFMNGEALDGTPRVTERMLLGERLVADGLLRGDVVAESDGLHIRALARLALADVGGFDRDRSRLEHLAPEVPNWYRQMFLQVWRGMRLMMEGRFAVVEAAVGELLGLASHEPNIQNLAFGQLLFLRREQGRLAELRPLVEQRAIHEPRITTIACAMALVDAETGRVAEAAGQLAALVDPAGVRAPRDFTWTTSLCLLAETAALVGDRRAAAVLLEELAPYRGQLAVLAKGVAVTGAVDRYIAMLQATLGDDAAGPSFEAAMRLDSSLGAPPLAARTKVCFGRWLSRQPGDAHRRRGETLLGEGRREALELTMSALAASSVAS
jgi:DNA-binding SARP family transcriptional activator